MPNENAQTPVKNEGRKTVVLSELGPLLPLGISANGSLHRDIAVRPWRMKEERELGDIRAAHPNADMAEYVSMVLATMCTRLGPYDFTSKEYEKLETRRLVVSQMYMGDVFAAYMWLRIQAMGPHIMLKVQLPGKQGAQNYKADLTTTNVVTAPSVEAAQFKYKLKNPINVRGKLQQEFTMAPIKWGSFEVEKESRNNQGAIKHMAINSAIIASDSLGSTQLGKAELEELSKFDLESMTSLIDKNSIGPVMVIEDKINGVPFRAAIDWKYDNFFSISSE